MLLKVAVKTLPVVSEMVFSSGINVMEPGNSMNRLSPCRITSSRSWYTNVIVAYCVPTSNVAVSLSTAEPE